MSGERSSLNLDGFVWTHFRDPEHLGECRLAAMRVFLADFKRGKQAGRYLAAPLYFNWQPHEGR